MMPKLFSFLLLAVSLPVAAGGDSDRIFLANTSAPVSIRFNAGAPDDSHTLYVGALNHNGVMVDDWRPVPNLALEFRGDELVFMLHDKHSNKIQSSGRLPHSSRDGMLHTSVTYEDGNAVVSLAQPDSAWAFTLRVSNVGNVRSPAPTGSDPRTWAILLGCLGMVSVVAHRRRKDV